MAKKNKIYESILKDFLALEWDFRVNDLDDTLEFKNSVSNGGWEPVSRYTEALIRTDMRELGYGVQGKKKPGFRAMEDTVLTRANDQRYNPILDYFSSLDGRYKASPNGPYMNELFAKFFTNSDNMFGRWLFRWMVGTIAKAHHGQRNPMLILVGPQKAGKSWFCEWICPVKDYFLRDSINPDDKDSHIRLTDHLVWEVEELGATTRRADVESLKAFVTRDRVKKRPAYGKQLVSKPALCSFIGTVNFDGAGFLNDYTGTTRFLACEVGEIDFDYTITDVDDLWGEAYWYYKNVPGSWKLTPEEEAIQEQINKAYEVPSALEDVITELYHITEGRQHFVATHDLKIVLGQYYRITSDQMFNRELSRELTKLGCEKGRASYTEGGEHRRGWFGLHRKAQTNE